MAKLYKRIKKGIKSIKGPGHSPAGKRYLKQQKKKKAYGTMPTYFKGGAFQRPSDTGGRVPEVDEMLRRMHKK